MAGRLAASVLAYSFLTLSGCALDDAPLPDRPDLLRQVEAIRGLHFQEPIGWKRVTALEMEDLLESRLEEAASERDWVRIERTLKAFDLIPPRSSLRRTLLTLLSEQALAFYDPDSKEMVVGEPPGDGLSEVIEAFEDLVFVHELTHALADQHFDLGSLPIDDLFQDDAQGAAMAVIEGDATWVMLRAIGTMDGVSPREAAEAEAAVLDLLHADMLSVTVPLYIRENLISPYANGLRMVRRAVQEGGPRGIDRLYREPPRSMEQVLHPEKYFRRDDPPIRFDVPLPLDWSRRGWTPYSTGIWGELNVRVLLIGWGVPPDEAARAAEGWGGDAYLVAEGPGGRIGWIWESRWDTPADADEFRSALAGKARLRIESCDGWIRVVRGGPGESLSAGPKP